MKTASPQSSLSAIEAMTDREAQACRMLIEGKSLKEIAGAMDIGTRRVQKIFQNLQRRLGQDSLRALAMTIAVTWALKGRA